MTTAVPRLLLDVDQAAEACSVGVTLIRQLIARKELPVVRLSGAGRGRGRVLINAAALQRWIDEQTEWPETAAHPFAKGLSVG